MSAPKKSLTADQARALFAPGVSSGLLRLGGNVRGKLVPAEKFAPYAERKPGDMTVENPRATAAAPADMEPAPTIGFHANIPADPPAPAITREVAAGMGYTGDQCSICNGVRMRNNGTCKVCEDCGTTTGCS